MNELQPIFSVPDLPEGWNYQESVEKVKGIIYRWHNHTGEMVMELWIAREMLSKEGRPETGASAPVKTWSQYCFDIGSTKSTVNRWLKAVETAPEGKVTAKEVAPAFISTFYLKWWTPLRPFKF